MPVVPAIAGGLISGFGSLLGSGISAISASNTNKTNKEIAQMNNETMLQAMREQTRSEQDYNSISSQMKRAITAGVNPMLLAGAQPTSASASSVPSLDTPVMQNPFANVDLGTSAIGSSMIQAKQLELQEKSLDVADFESTIKMLQTVGDLAKSGNLTSDDISSLVKSFIRPDKQGSITSLAQDAFIKTKFTNAIETSNLDVKEKKFLFGWLDEMTNAQFTNILADTELKQTQSNVNRSISRLNDTRRREIEQAISNMKEQFRSLSATADMDVIKLKKFAEYFDAEVKKLSNEANISEQDAKHWLWLRLLPYSQKSWKLGPISGSGNQATNPFSKHHPSFLNW